VESMNRNEPVTPLSQFQTEYMAWWDADLRRIRDAAGNGLTPPTTPNHLRCLVVMQKWEYRIFASHLDPAELVIILNDSGKDGWELVTVVAITDYQPLDLIEPGGESKDESEVVELEAFRYIFKRPVK
jgi:hypothetical protein